MTPTRLTTPRVTPVVRPDFTTKSPRFTRPTRGGTTFRSRMLGLNRRPEIRATAQSPENPKWLRASVPTVLNCRSPPSNGPGWRMGSPKLPLGPCNTCQLMPRRVPAVSLRLATLMPGRIGSMGLRRCRSRLGAASSAGSSRRRHSQDVRHPVDWMLSGPVPFLCPTPTDAAPS